MSLSIDETNKLRASLGLKPLTVDSNASANPDAPKSSNSDENFVHKPAVNITEKKRTEQVLEKLSLQKEKRMLQEKFRYVYSRLYTFNRFRLIFVFSATSTLASESAESATSWVEKMRKTEEEKRKAAARVRIYMLFD